MPLKPPPLKSAPHLVCDWIELKTLASPTGQFRIGSLKRLWDTSRESEGTDPEGLDERESDTDQEGVNGGDEDAYIDSIIEEIGDRVDALGDNYPFRLDVGNKLSVLEPGSDGGYGYLFCLFLTHANGRELLDASWRPAVDNRIRDLFQACSTVAAAGEVRGCAISFGWPRPDENLPFLMRLRQVYALFGEGVVVQSPRKGVSPCPKDEEIDVIAWRPRADRAAGTEYLLGQVASGDNWESKPIVGGPIAAFHRNWFEPPPASVAKASIFIPHAVPPATDKGTRRERMDAVTVKFGIIIDRLRLPRLMQEGLDLADQSQQGLMIERVGDLPLVKIWVLEQIHSLLARSS
jgi:hypothetical protein